VGGGYSRKTGQNIRSEAARDTVKPPVPNEEFFGKAPKSFTRRADTLEPQPIRFEELESHFLVPGCNNDLVPSPLPFPDRIFEEVDIHRMIYID
jgi:hypothetical protein